jgi:hypothetical protein
MFDRFVCSTPFVALYFTRNHPGNWKYATLTWAFFGLMELVVLFFMKVPNNHPLPKAKRNLSWEFLKTKII